MLSLIAVASASIIEIGMGIASNSIAVVSDGMHALFDSFILATVLIMFRFSLKPRDKEHTYGHGRLETIAAFIGGIMLFIIATFIINESFARLFSDKVVISSIISIYAVIYAIVIASFRIIILRFTNIHSKSIKVGLYDAIADLGSSSLALIAVILATYGLYIFDAIASFILAILLLFLTSRLVYSSIMELTDAIDPRLIDEARDAIIAIDGIKECKDIRMRKVGDSILADVIVVMDSNLSFNKAHMLSNKIEQALKDSINASMVMVHFEPEEYTSIEDKIKDIAKEVKGIKDVHNIMVSNTPEGKVVSMHIQVDRSLNLEQAHMIADSAERLIRDRINARNVTIHIEPLMKEMKSMVKIDDSSIRSIVEEIAEKERIRIDSMNIYSSNGIIRLDIHCRMDKCMSIEDAHYTVTKFEHKIRDRLNAIVNIHTEPS